MIPVRQWGRGPIRVWLFHGFTGSGHSFDGLEPLLGERITALVPTLPGHGEVAAPSSGREGFVETSHALAALVQPGDTLLGYSQGARLALGAVLLGGAQPHRLILESGSPGLRRSQDRAQRMLQDELLAQRIEDDGVEAFVRHWESLPLFAGIARLPPQSIEALRSRRLSHSAAGLAGALRGMGLGVQPSFWDRLPSLRVPLLCLSGRHDARFTRTAQAMSVAAPVGYHSVLPCGHACHLEASQAWADELLRFAQAPFPVRLHGAEEAA